MFSGLNLALFSLSRLQLEIEVKQGDVAAGKVLSARQGNPQLLLDADAALLEIDKPYDIYSFCRRPLVIRDTTKTIGEVISHLKSLPSTSDEEDSAIDYDAVLIWGDEPRIITGADILGKLLKGINPTDVA